MDLKLKLNLNKKTSRFDQVKLKWWCIKKNWHVHEWKNQILAHELVIHVLVG
jgi:hypothetical protein